MKKAMFVIIMVLMVASAAFAKPVWLAQDAWVDADPTSNAVRFTWKFAGLKDMWADNQVQFCPDPLRGGCDANIPFASSKVGSDTYVYEIPKDVISGGQSALNLANDQNWFDALWLGLPDCRKLHLGRNLIYYKSIADPDIPKSGGMHLLYIGPGAPFVPQPGDPRLYVCGPAGGFVPANTKVETPKSVAVPTVKKYKRLPNGNICEDPCIQETLQNTREIKADVKEIKTDVKEVKADVKDVKESVGAIDPADPADEKTVQQKTRKTLKKIKDIKKEVGTSKSGRSLHDKVGEFKRKNGTVAGTLEEIHKDVKDIKTKTGSSNADCVSCHKDAVK